MTFRLFYIMVLATALVVSACSSTSDSPAEDGDAGDVNLDPAVAAVMAAIDALNSYDLDGWLMAHDGGERRESRCSLSRS
jgi:hypothetical protein